MSSSGLPNLLVLPKENIHKVAATLTEDVMKSVKNLLNISHERMIQEVQRCNAMNDGASWDIVYQRGYPTPELYTHEVDGHRLFMDSPAFKDSFHCLCICGGIVQLSTSYPYLSHLEMLKRHVQSVGPCKKAIPPKYRYAMYAGRSQVRSGQLQILIAEDIEASTNKTNVIRLQNENAELKVEIERLKGILATGVHIDASDTSSESPFDIISKYCEEAQAKLEQRAADFQLRMETVSTALQSRENELERSIIEFAKTKSYLTSLFEDNSEPRAVIHLNVGGTRYSIPKQTLCNSPYEKSEHMFVNMFNERWEVKYDESGTVFVDGNGRLFEYIVQWLRHGIVPQALSDDDRKALVLDSEYFMMDDFKARLTTGSKGRSPLLIKPK